MLAQFFSVPCFSRHLDCQRYCSRLSAQECKRLRFNSLHQSWACRIYKGHQSNAPAAVRPSVFHLNRVESVT